MQGPALGRIRGAASAAIPNNLFSLCDAAHLLLAALLLCAALATGQHVEPGQTFTGRVVDVKDGDTYDVRRSIGGTVTIRLHGVDTPESGQSYGRQATRKARQYVGGENVRATVEDVDRYGRVVARIEVQGGDLGAMLNRGVCLVDVDREPAGQAVMPTLRARTRSVRDDSEDCHPDLLVQTAAFWRLRLKEFEHGSLLEIDTR